MICKFHTFYPCSSIVILLQIIIFTEAGVDKSGGDAQIPAKLPAESAKPHT